MRKVSWQLVWYVCCFGTVVLISIETIFPVFVAPQIQFQEQQIIPTSLNLSAGLVLPFQLNINSYQSQWQYIGTIKVLHPVFLRVDINNSLVSGYEIELNLTNPVVNTSTTQNSNAQIISADSLSLSGCPTRVIHVLITREGRVVGIPFYGLICTPAANMTVSFFPYSYFVFATNASIPSSINQPLAYFDFLNNLSMTSYWEDWQTLVAQHSETSVWNLLNRSYLWDNNSLTLTPVSLLNTAFLANQVLGQDPWTPILPIQSGETNDIGGLFLEWYTALATQVYEVWHSVYYSFPFFQPTNIQPTAILHVGTAMIVFSHDIDTTGSSQYSLSLPNMTITGYGVPFEQANVLATYAWKTGYPSELYFWLGNTSYLDLSAKNQYLVQYTFQPTI